MSTANQFNLLMSITTSTFILYNFFCYVQVQSKTCLTHLVLEICQFLMIIFKLDVFICHAILLQNVKQ